MHDGTHTPRHARYYVWIANVFALSLWLLGPRLALAQPRAYVTNEKSDDVTVIDTASDTVVATIKVGKRPRGIAVSPDGKRAYTANGNSNDISVLDLQKNTVIGKLPAGEDRRALKSVGGKSSRNDPLRDSGDHQGVGETAQRGRNCGYHRRKTPSKSLSKTLVRVCNSKWLYSNIGTKTLIGCSQLTVTQGFSISSQLVLFRLPLS